ncbi:urease accessory protein UreD [Halobacteriales archaeon QH_6_64_20]|nr:MAG: urease accessory protein UreD [Halobacteriales archaeon QH_6_64_20]
MSTEDIEAPYPAFEAYADEPIPQAAPGAPGKEGELELVFAADGGRTRLVHDYARVPYHVSGTLAHDPHSDAATVYVQSPTGGIAQGDRLRADIRTNSGAVASVSTGSATKVQSMDRNYAAARTSLAADPRSHLEYVPEPTILHEGARFSRETTLTVAASATAIVGEAVVPGRLARGERFDFERYFSRLCVDGPDGLLFEDATHLRPNGPDESNEYDRTDEAEGTDRPGPTAPGVCGEFSVHGSLYVVAPEADGSSLADRLHERVTGAEREVRAAATTLPNGAGALVRALADRAETATETLHEAWDGARRELSGVGAPDTRRY